MQGAHSKFLLSCLTNGKIKEHARSNKPSVSNTCNLLFTACEIALVAQNIAHLFSKVQNMELLSFECKVLSNVSVVLLLGIQVLLMPSIV